MKKQDNKLVQKDDKEKITRNEGWDKDPEELLKISEEDLLDIIPDEEEITPPPYEAPEPGEGP